MRFSVVKRAGEDTWKLATRQSLVVTLVLAFIGFGGYWLLRGTHDAKEQFVTWGLFGVVPVVVLIAGAFVWNLARASVLLRLEATEAALKAAEAGLSDVGGLRVTLGRVTVEAPDYERGDALEIEERPQGVVIIHRSPEDES